MNEKGLGPGMLPWQPNFYRDRLHFLTEVCYVWLQNLMKTGIQNHVFVHFNILSSDNRDKILSSKVDQH